MKSIIVSQDFVPGKCRRGCRTSFLQLGCYAVAISLHYTTHFVLIQFIRLPCVPCRGESGWCLDMTSTHGAWRHAEVQFLLPGDWFMLIKMTKNDAKCCNELNRTSSHKPVIAQLVEHLTVDSCSNQMVPGSIPGDRISWMYCRTHKHEASIRMLGIFDGHQFPRHLHCFSCTNHQKFQADACQGNDIPPIEKGSCAGGTSR